MQSRRRDLTLLVIAAAIAFAPLAYSAEVSQSRFVGQEVMGEVVPTGPDCCPTAIPALPAEFAICHEPGVPAWYFQMEGLALKRDASRDQTFQYFVERVWEEVANPKYEEPVPPAVPDPAEPEYIWQWTEDIVTPVLGTQNLHFGFQGGGRALIGRTLGQCHAFEVSYFDVTDWSEMAAVRDDTLFVQDKDRVTGAETTFSASLFSPFCDYGPPVLPLLGLDYNYLASISYTSSLNNLEFNLRRWILVDPCRLQASVLVGGRYMNLDESFFYYTESAEPIDPAPGGATNTVTTDTDNRMLGVQVGAMFEFHVDPGWWIDCEIKGAFFDNAASQNTTYVHDGVPAYDGTYTWGRDDHISAYALDLKLTATVLVTPRLAVRGGYQALWLDGLALASENMSQDANILMGGPASLVEDGKVVYHGPHLGISWVW
jgi:hypothetical protein